MRMNPPSFIGSNTIEDPKNLVEKLLNVLNVIHVVGVERVELAAYQQKNL